MGERALKRPAFTWKGIALPPLVGIGAGLIAVRWGIVSLLPGVLVVGLVGFLLTANTVIPAGVALFSLVLLPKSLPALKVGGFAFGWSIGDVLIMAAFGAVVLRGLVTRKTFVLPGTATVIDRAIVVAYCLTLIPAAAVGVLHEPDRLVWMVGSLIKAWEIFLLYAAARMTISGRRTANIAVGFFMALLSGVVAIAIIQRLFPEAYARMLLAIGSQSTGYSESFLASVGWRLAGPFLNANTLGSFLIIGVMFVIGHQRTAPGGGLHSVMQMVILAASVTILVLTLSREAYLGFGVALMYLVISGLRHRSTRRGAVWVIVLLGICLWYFLPILYGRVITYTFSGQAPSLQALMEAHSIKARIEQWVAALRALPTYGIFGAGLGRFATAVGEFLPSGSESFGGVHQTYLRALLEGGILELVGLLYLQWAIWRVAGSFPMVFRVTTRATLLGLMVTGLFGDTFQDIDLMASFLFLLVALQARSLTPEARRDLSEYTLVNGENPWEK